MHNTTVNHNYYLTNFSDSAISSKSQSSTHQFRCFEVQYEYVDLNTTHSCSNLLPLGTTTQLCDSAQIELANRTLFVKRRGAKSFTSDSGWLDLIGLNSGSTPPTVSGCCCHLHMDLLLQILHFMIESNPCLEGGAFRL